MKADIMGQYNRGARYRLNNATMWAASGLVFATPFFLGGNRPAVWALTATLTFFWATWYGFRLLVVSGKLRIQVADMGLVSILFALLVLYQVLQLLPLASWLPQQWLALPYGAYVGSSLSLSPQDTLLALMRWVGYGVLFFLTVQFCANSGRAKTFLSVLFWIVVIHAAYGAILLFELGDTILFTKKWAYEGWATGGFVNRNSYATFLAIGLTVGVSLLTSRLAANDDSGIRQAGGRNSIIFSLSGLAVILVALVATGSRMGVFVGLCGAFVAFVLGVAGRGVRVKRSRIAILFAGICLAVAATFFLYGELLAERIMSVEQDHNIRSDLYNQIRVMIADRPFFGFGGDSFEHAYPLYHHAPVSADMRWDRAHSTYLALWSEYGLVFGSIPLLIIGIWALMLTSYHMRRGATAPVSGTALAVILVGALHSLVDFSLEIEGVTFLFIVVIAAGVAVAINDGKRLAQTPGNGDAA